MRRTLAALIAVLMSALVGAPPAHAEPLFLNYRAHVQFQGWQVWKNQPSAAGTSGLSLRMEALQLRGGNGTVQAHVQDFGWMQPVQTGDVAGTVGQSKRLEAVRVKSDLPGWAIECQAHVQERGWLPWVADGKTCGTTGLSLRLEAIRLRMVAVDVPVPTATPTASPTATPTATAAPTPTIHGRQTPKHGQLCGGIVIWKWTATTLSFRVRCATTSSSC